MSRKVSLNQRLAQDAGNSADIEIVLVKITHPMLYAPIRLSSDNGSRISLEPLLYGTYSTWLTDDLSPFYFMLMSVILPGDQDDAPASASIVLEAVDNRVVKLLRSVNDRADISMAVVSSAHPDLLEAHWRGLKLVSSEGSSTEIVLNISRDPITSEPWPARRMTRQQFPGLHK